VLIVIVLGLGGGIFVARRVLLRRIDAMTGTAQAHHGGRSERAVAGRAAAAMSSIGWAENLNAMLERIEGPDGRAEGSLRQHRPRSEDTADAAAQTAAEDALAKSSNEGRISARRWERTIEESDGLDPDLSTRCLMIARAESGQARGQYDQFSTPPMSPMASTSSMSRSRKTTA